jgi:hypothetical protein
LITHAITGRSSLEIAGEVRTLACDMNCAAALYEAKGDRWSEWLVDRFLGEAVEVDGGKHGRRVKPISPADTITALHALLATDREDGNRVGETEKSLRRSLGLAAMPDVQLAMMRAVLAGFGLPGEFIEAVAKAVDGPRDGKTADGTGIKL